MTKKSKLLIVFGTLIVPIIIICIIITDTQSKTLIFKEGDKWVSENPQIEITVDHEENAMGYMVLDDRTLKIRLNRTKNGSELFFLYGDEKKWVVFLHSPYTVNSKNDILLKSPTFWTNISNSEFNEIVLKYVEKTG